MSDINVTIPGGKAKRLKTAGTYCEQDIIVTAEKPMPLTEKEVNFYDFDGTLLYAYTIEEAQALTELPPLPTQTGLICQGWNWTLEKIKEQGKTDVSAIYITDDGKTRVVVEITDLVSPMIYLNWNGATVNLDWGDGSAIEMNVTAGNHQHEYASIGEYEITLEVVSGTLSPTRNDTLWAFVGNNLVHERAKLNRVYFGRSISSSFAWLGFINAYNLTEITIPEGITKIEGTVFSNARRLRYIGLPKSVVFIDHNAFAYCRSIQGISLPEALETIGNSALVNCYALKQCIIPRKVTSIGSAIFNNNDFRTILLPESITMIPNQCCDGCELLSEVKIPNSITSIGSYAFRNCKCLSSLKIPVNVETIDQNAFANCVALKKFKFLPISPPTVTNANAFTGIPTDCIVEVPAESLETYKNATNYASIAAQMVGVSSFD